MPFDLPELPKSEPSSGNGSAPPFRPSQHSMALRQGIGVSMQCAQMAQRAQLMPARDAKLDAILECLTHVLLTQAHLADAVLELQGEPRAIEFRPPPERSLVAES